MKRGYVVWLLLTFGACWRLGGPVMSAPSPFHGFARGAYHQEPLAGVLVIGIWNSSDILALEGRPTRARFVSAAVTNRDGEFELPPPGLRIRSPLVTYARKPDLAAWKPGFTQLDTDRDRVVMWPVPADIPKVGQPPRSPEILAEDLEAWVEQDLGGVELDRFPQVRAAIAAYARTAYPQLAQRQPAE